MPWKHERGYKPKPYMMNINGKSFQIGEEPEVNSRTIEENDVVKEVKPDADYIIEHTWINGERKAVSIWDIISIGEGYIRINGIDRPRCITVIDGDKIITDNYTFKGYGLYVTKAKHYYHEETIEEEDDNEVSGHSDNPLYNELCNFKKSLKSIEDTMVKTSGIDPNHCEYFEDISIKYPGVRLNYVRNIRREA